MMSIFAFKAWLISYTLLGDANKPNELNAFREMMFMQNPMLFGFSTLNYPILS